jgi:hypothetical protein
MVSEDSSRHAKALLGRIGVANDAAEEHIGAAWN